MYNDHRSSIIETSSSLTNESFDEFHLIRSKIAPQEEFELKMSHRRSSTKDFNQFQTKDFNKFQTKDLQFNETKFKIRTHNFLFNPVN